MTTDSLFLYFLIIGCEIAFWAVLLLSLVVRYVLQQKVASRWLLWSLPLIDLLLVAFTALDLRTGTTATLAHGLAAAYVGFTVAFGPITIRWADSHFAHRFAAGPAPQALPTAGWAAVRFDLELWLRCIVAWVMALAVLEAMIAFVANDAVTQPLHAWYKHAFGCVVVWFVLGPVWSAAGGLSRPN